MKVSNKDPAEVAALNHSKKSHKAHAASAKAADSDAASAASASSDPASVSISSEAKAMSAANQVAKADDVNQAKVDRVKAMINGGTYKPDMGKVADRVINEHMMQELS